MINPKVLLLALNYFGIVTASLGMLIFIPQIIKSLGDSSNMTVGWLTMIPYICGGIAMVVWGRISDRMNERRWNLFIACMFSTVGLVMAGMTMGTWWALVGMSIAAMGFYGSKGPFFAMPPMFLSGTAAGRRHRLDQLDRQSRRLLRALVCRRHERSDRQLRRRTLRAGAARPGRRRSSARSFCTSPTSSRPTSAHPHWRRPVSVDVQTAFVPAAVCCRPPEPCPRSRQRQRGPSTPERPIRLVVPFPPGGVTDVVARLTAERLTAEFGQQVMVDNKAGAGGVIAGEIVAKAPADGYTILFTTPNHTINAALRATMPYDTEKDLTGGRRMIGQVPMLLVTHPSLPVTTSRASSTTRARIRARSTSRRPATARCRTSRWNC